MILTLFDLADYFILAINYKILPILNFKLFKQKNKPVRKIYWERLDGSKLSTNVRTHSGILEIINISENDEGYYACNVITFINQHLKKTIHITKPKEFSPQMPILKIVPIEVDIRRGGRVELECQTVTFKSYKLTFNPRQDEQAKKYHTKIEIINSCMI
ncbi:basement membrane-specific heparan sulfate proteoglycan core [Brachionus plicatilis]|uniref:Basement membrane-specific heparan sulfate proteoglycan core n=1 Tax=Brachionus plicatilis TaxID=10195 RepID=A0A3M7SDT9_BRAPC|nr:basement membrane-specific heparan sulfate proteoglycan core [Brachionus plicatilis]